MDKIETSVKLTQHNKNKKAFWLYIINAPIAFAKVHAPQKSYSGDLEFGVNVFITEAIADQLLGEEINLNKEFKLVGKDKTKTRKIKYPLSTQVDEGKPNFDFAEGLGGINVTATAEFSYTDKKTGKERVAQRKITVLNKDNENITTLIGNGSICTLKCYGYRNKDGQLNITLDTIQVLDLVPFEPSSEAGVVEDEVLGTYKRSYSAEAKTTKTDISEEEMAQDNHQSDDDFDTDFEDDIPF